MTLRRYATLPLMVAVLTACGTAQAPGGTTSSGTSGAGSNSASASATAPSSAVATDCPPAEGVAERTTEFAAAPPMCIDPAKSYTAQVKTDLGEFTIALDAKAAPKTVNNFVFLARHKYYDGIVFHRVIPGFMNQTGDPQGTGQGGPGYEFEDELPAEGAYQVGSVAMANAGDDTNGSQFFIVTGENGVALPAKYSLFGTVTSGMEVVHAIEEDGSPTGEPSTIHRMESVTITEK